jgi:hypothetical protein
MFGRGRQVRVDGAVVAEAVHKSHTTDTGQQYTRMKYVIEFERPGAGIERVELKETERLGSKVMRSLTTGDTAPLLVDAKSGKVRFDTDDPRINLKVRMSKVKHREDDRFKEALDGGDEGESDVD